MKKTRLLLIEENHLLREGLIAILRRQEDIAIVAVSDGIDSTILKIHQMKPDIILLDLDLRSQNSLHTVGIVKKEFPEAKVVVMDLAPLQGDIRQYVNAGASGFVLKDTTFDDFLAAIRAVAEGAQALPPKFSDSLFSKIVEHAIKSKRIKSTESVRMSKTEKEVFGYLGDGMTDKEIGRKLHAPTRMVKGHVQNIMKKLSMHNRLESVNHKYTEGTLKAIVRSASVIDS
ncbi:MAG TPA: response regulator transcription factor [Candidatus Kryptonia bacterium]